MSAPAISRDEPAAADRPFARILLASEGRPFAPATVERVIELARASGASVHVFSIARVHGVSLGMPNPGLLPTKAEWRAQHELVAAAVKRLKRKGIDADGHVLGTRKSTRAILQEAEAEGCDAIVMSADRDRNRLVGDMLWTQEPQRVRRKARLPVFLIPVD